MAVIQQRRWRQSPKALRGVPAPTPPRRWRLPAGSSVRLDVARQPTGPKKGLSPAQYLILVSQRGW